MVQAARVLSLCAALALAPALAGADLSGTWDLVWDTEGGIRETEWKITQAGESLQVESDGNTFAGTFDGSTVRVEGKFYSAEAGYSATLKVEGKFEDGELTGRGTWDLYAMTFTATRSD